MLVRQQLAHKNDCRSSNSVEVFLHFQKHDYRPQKEESMHIAKLTKTPFPPPGKQRGMRSILAQSMTMAQAEPLFFYVKSECFAMTTRQERSKSL